MWKAEEEFEIVEDVEQYDLEDEIDDEFPSLELNRPADEDSDVFEYEDDLFRDEEDE
jgi:hypothetical protein